MYSLSATLLAIKNTIQNKPVEIHDIYLGSQTEEDANTLHFVNFYRAISFFTYIGHVAQSYTPLGLGRSAIKKTSKGEIENVSYKIDNVNKAMGAYAAVRDFRNKRIVTRLIFRNQLTSYLDCKVIFDGFITNIAFEKSSVSASSSPRIGSLGFETGWIYQLKCNAYFGDRYCTINKEATENKVVGTTTGGDIKDTVYDTINLTSHANDYWKGGTVHFTSGVNNGLSRKIIGSVQASGALVLDYPIDYYIVIGDSFTVYRGCDKTLAMCTDVYNNNLNFHGFHTIPLTK